MNHQTKEPYEMTMEEFSFFAQVRKTQNGKYWRVEIFDKPLKYGASSTDRPYPASMTREQAIEEARRDTIREAIRFHTVPASVLADYPELV